MMEYRVNKKTGDRVSEIGIGSAFQFDDPAECVKALRAAYEGGINMFDLGAGHSDVFPLYGEALADVRDRIFYQIHFGAVYPEGTYARSSDFDQIARSVENVLQQVKTDYIDYGFISCFDELADWEAFKANGVYARMLELKEQGVIRHIALSSHTPATAQRIMDEVDIELLMFSFNPAYDFEAGGEYAFGKMSERTDLLDRCERENLGISVMKPFSGGQLLSASTSPFGRALTPYQCIQYALMKPPVLTVFVGVQNMSEVQTLLGFHEASAEERDCSLITSLSPAATEGRCVYCNHCQPCPAGLEIGRISKYYDLARAGDDMALDHYRKMYRHASDCIGCGFCDEHCPFGVEMSSRMYEISEYMAARGLS